jgi:2'-5' RNA ligase
MRLFIAFEIPEDISNSLSALQERIKLDGKATKPKSFHLTLKFLGEVDEEKLSILIEELSKVQFNSFETSLSDIGAFPDMNRPRVVWVGLEPQNTINELQKQIDSATQKLGFDPDNRFHPHLTLARIKFVKNKKEFKDMIENLKPPQGSFTLNSFKLIKSTLTPQGPEYEILHSFEAQQ